MNIEAIARVCHEVNRAYCASIGDTSQAAWEASLAWQRESAIKGVQFTIDNPQATPADSHASWRAEKARDGWRYGRIKDATLREHPCMVEYKNLPLEQRTKDYLFQAVVRAMQAAQPA